MLVVVLVLMFHNHNHGTKQLLDNHRALFGAENADASRTRTTTRTTTIPGARPLPHADTPIRFPLQRDRCAQAGIRDPKRIDQLHRLMPDLLAKPINQTGDSL